MPYARYTTEEVGIRGQALYDQKIRDTVEAKHHGRFLVLDITTGEYEIDDSDLVASKRALAKNPDAVLYGLRVGYPAAYRLGVGSTDPVARAQKSPSSEGRSPSPLFR
jgi:hypothetical protein